MKHFPILIILFLSQISFGQSMNTLRGKIMDENNAPIVNAHIQINGTNIGSVSNVQGIFNLKIPVSYCNLDMIFSHISYLSISKKIVCEQQGYLIILPERTFELDEVQVSALSAERIVLNAILNLQQHYQVDSVNYTIV